MGQCPECEAWNTFVEGIPKLTATSRQRIAGNTGTSATVLKFSDVKDYDKQLNRLSTGMEEFDRVLGVVS